MHGPRSWRSWNASHSERKGSAQVWRTGGSHQALGVRMRVTSTEQFARAVAMAVGAVACTVDPHQCPVLGEYKCQPSGELTQCETNFFDRSVWSWSTAFCAAWGDGTE